VYSPAAGAHTKRTSVCRSSSVRSHAVPPVMERYKLTHLKHILKP
jgi:hypothetical protein